VWKILFFYQNHQWIAGFRSRLVSRLLLIKKLSGIYRTFTAHLIKNMFCSVLFIFYALQLYFYLYWAKTILNGCLLVTLFLRPVPYRVSVYQFFRVSVYVRIRSDTPIFFRWFFLIRKNYFLCETEIWILLYTNIKNSQKWDKNFDTLKIPKNARDNPAFIFFIIKNL